MNHTELRGRDVGCVLGLGADRLWDRSSFLPLLLLLLLLSAPRQQQQPPPQQQQQPAGRRSALRRPGAPGCCPSEEDTTTATTHALVPGRSSNTRANGFYSWSCARPQNQGMDISELEFVQIIIILLVMTLMVVLIICLLSHYWLPALAFLSRLGHAQRDRATQLDGAAWPDSVLAQRNAEVMHGHLSSSLPPFMQQQRLCRLQPTYPYLPQELINLPPLICLSDGEELLPYKGPCRLQLRPLEQQLELSRAAVRAPPNRTVFDRDLIDIYTHNNKNPRAPSSNSGLNAARAMMEDPPPSYSTVMGDYTGSTDQYSQYSNNTPPPTEDRSGPESTAEASSDLKS